MDTTAIVATITGGIAVVSAIGMAGLSVLATVAIFKWVRRAF